MTSIELMLVGPSAPRILTVMLATSTGSTVGLTVDPEAGKSVIYNMNQTVE